MVSIVGTINVTRIIIIEIIDQFGIAHNITTTIMIDDIEVLHIITGDTSIVILATIRDITALAEPML
jgi:hypothetical protein